MIMKQVAIVVLVIVLLVVAVIYIGKDEQPANVITEPQTQEVVEEMISEAEDASEPKTIDESEIEIVEEAEGEVKEFTIDSFNFGYSLEEITVNEGDTVTINLTNSDGFHDWVVDEFGAATEKIQAGGVTSVTFVAGEAGTYEYYCSVGSHRANGMVGKLIVK
tara:strand:+ start:3955 stop:4443 length:489 start_codon:yes stop_codon:yes gene_type:complete